MARECEAQRIERANLEAALERFSASLQELRDPRRRRGLRYPLETVIVSALMAMVADCDDAEAMAVWSEANADWLGTFLTAVADFSERRRSCGTPSEPRRPTEAHRWCDAGRPTKVKPVFRRASRSMESVTAVRMPHGAPSQDVYLHVLAGVEPSG